MSQTESARLPRGYRVMDRLPAVALEVTYARVATLVAGTWDVFPGHHDPRYASEQGQRDIYLNTMVLAGFFDRVVLDWAGPESFIRKRSMRIVQSVYPGDELTGEATVLCMERAASGLLDVTLDVVCSTASGPCLAGEVIVRVPEVDEYDCSVAGIQTAG